jgi:uncharacterized phiE125 gp8 family phage protein
MIVSEALVLPAAAADEAKAYLRVVLADEDALIARLMTSAAELCEQFAGQALIARGFSETLRASAAWQRLGRTPVRSIGGVETLTVEGAATALPAAAFAVDIDANGDGWVRIAQPTAGLRVRVAYQAGMATDWAGLPEALRQGIVRLAAHLYAERDKAGDASPPAVVAALWRPYRRMRIS